MAKFATNTSVSTERSRAEIETVLRRYGASHFGYASAPDKAVIGFQASDRRVKFVVPMPDPNTREFTHTAARGTRREPKAAYDEWEKACRQRWRALALCIKAKLEAVECGITTFESEFLAHIVLPNGETMADRALPYIAQAYETNTMPPMITFDG